MPVSVVRMGTRVSVNISPRNTGAHVFLFLLLCMDVEHLVKSLANVLSTKQIAVSGVS